MRVSRRRMNSPTTEVLTTQPPAPPDRRVIITALGVTQILAWGSSYYLPAVLAAPPLPPVAW